MASLNHVHTYERRKGIPKLASRFQSYVCIHPDCSHTIGTDLLLHKRARCICGKTFIIDNANYYFSRAQLRCPNCSTSKRSKSMVAAQEVMDDIFKLPVELKSPIEDVVLKIPSVESIQTEIPNEEKIDARFSFWDEDEEDTLKEDETLDSDD